MNKNLNAWIGTLGTLAIIGVLTLGGVPSLAKGRKPITGHSVLVTKTDAPAPATKAKKVSIKAPSTPKPSGEQASGAKADQPKSAPKAPKASKAKLTVGNQVNINTATTEELAKLPRVGLKVAQRIVEYRTAHRSFKSVDELRNVKGVGAKVLEGIKPYAVV